MMQLLVSVRYMIYFIYSVEIEQLFESHLQIINKDVSTGSNYGGVSANETQQSVGVVTKKKKK